MPTTIIFAALPLLFVLQWAVATVFFPALKLPTGRRAAALMLVAVPMVLAPLVIPRTEPLIRFLVAVNAVAALLKLWDLHLAARQGSRPELGAFLRFLPRWSTMMFSNPAGDRRTRRERSTGLIRSLLVLTAWYAVLLGLVTFDWSDLPWVLEHSIKAIAFLFGVLAFFSTLVELERFAGRVVPDFSDAPLRAVTPADFWRRYNRPVGRFLFWHVFMPAGGRRSPVFATLMVFAASALIHEYVFGIAIGRIQGYQTLFFMLQGCGVAATMRVKPVGSSRIPWSVATFAFNLASSAIFFASFQGLVNFYSRGIPAWLVW